MFVYCDYLLTIIVTFNLYIIRILQHLYIIIIQIPNTITVQLLILKLTGSQQSQVPVVLVWVNVVIILSKFWFYKYFTQKEFLLQTFLNDHINFSLEM